ncbi:50S ribosomal protein L10 [Candidatus Peregrinibacteria bacterium]|nr:50S ribosomal protein L10 [Candidatus Peregrinibacteria bacterium]
MAVAKQQKSQILDELIENFKAAKSVVFNQYQGSTVKDMRDLRRALRAGKVKFKVARKTLMLIAAKKAGFEQIPNEILSGPIGLAFGTEDEIAPLKITHDFGRQHEKIKITGAIFEGKLLSAAEAKIIASLPGREILLAKLVGCLKSPIAGFHAVLHGLLRNFVYALSEISKKKPVESPAASAAPPPA